MQISIPIPLALLSRLAQAALVGVIAAHPEQAYETARELLAHTLRVALHLLAS